MGTGTGGATTTEHSRSRFDERVITTKRPSEFQAYKKFSPTTDDDDNSALDDVASEYIRKLSQLPSPAQTRTIRGMVENIIPIEIYLDCKFMNLLETAKTYSGKLNTILPASFGKHRGPKTVWDGLGPSQQVVCFRVVQ